MALGQERADNPYSLPCSSALSRLAALQRFFIDFNVMEALLLSLISKTSPPDDKGIAMGICSTGQLIGVAIGGRLRTLLPEGVDEPGAGADTPCR